MDRGAWTEEPGQRSLVGYSPWGCKESNTTDEQLHFFFFLSFYTDGGGDSLVAKLRPTLAT